jgi:urease subunit gamma
VEWLAAKVPPDRRYQFHALFPDWNGPVGNLGPASVSAGPIFFVLISMAAMVARRRLERGVKLNHPESVALITDFIVEGARDGKTVAELMEAGAHVLTRSQVIDGIAEMIHEIQVENP